MGQKDVFFELKETLLNSLCCPGASASSKKTSETLLLGKTWQKTAIAVANCEKMDRVRDN
jgi:hypothetical protein